MKQMDRFKILGTATELMAKHMQVSVIKHLKGVDIEPALTKAYKTAETALLAYIRQQVAPIKTVSALVDSFKDSCFGLGALGMRQDLMRKKLLGSPKNGQQAFADAIDKGTKSEPIPCIAGFAGESILDDEIDNLSAHYLSSDAFSDNFFAHINHDTNSKALAFMLLLDYGYAGIDLSAVVADIKYSSCLKAITDKSWAERSLAGYHTEDDDVYVSDVINPEFIGIFASKLKVLLAQNSTSESAEYFQALQIKQYLHKQVITAFAGFADVSPIEVYGDINRLIVAPEGITQVAFNDVHYSTRFAVTRRYGSCGVRFEINLEALQSLVDTLKALGLGDLPEVAVFIGKVRA